VDDKTHELLQMRAEWLKVRGYLYDPNTSLPAVPAVLEDVRRRIEKGERVGVIYLDVSGEEYLEEVYGWATYDGLLQQVAQALGACKGPLLGDDDVVALAGVRSDQFLVFVGLDDRRGARELAQLRERVVSELGRRIKIQVGKEMPRAIGLHAASSVLKYDPTVRIERSIYKVLDGIRLDCLRDREQSLGIRRRELSRILQSRDILIRYQPIVRLGDGSVFGYEALSCGPDGDVFQNPEMLFSFAEKTDQIVDLERLCRVESVRGSVRLPRGHKLFLNCSAHGIGDVEGLSTNLVTQAKAAGLAPSDVVLEITERVAVTAWNDFRKRIDDLRAMGFGVAIDDMGAGYSSLHSVAEVEPDFLKFDIALVRDIHLSPIKRGLLESLVLLAERIDSQVIAEGVEKEEEFETLREMNVPFGQGFLFSPPTTLAFHVPESP
jgi:EAL domain-containing protein (putative c-di-GMP-specific phosphodiesterase class I)/GGDEF domain-containing protein